MDVTSCTQRTYDQFFLDTPLDFRQVNDCPREGRTNVDSYDVIQPATITVANYTDLKDVWEGLFEPDRCLIGRVVVERRLTARQSALLPGDLREIVDRINDEILFCQRLHRLRDPRGERPAPKRNRRKNVEK